MENIQEWIVRSVLSAEVGGMNTSVETAIE